MKSISVGFLAFVIVLVIGLPLAWLQYDYENKKCDNMVGSAAYGFNQKVEVNAEYNEECFFLHNHPLAFETYLLYPLLFGTLAGVLGMFFHSVATDFKDE